ncbi:beta-propeller fold lactonase family protein [Buchnera aphidicola (Mindarus keteleerifoliae)]|uniref:beta-propeller fold lactonase family protein n=1 Tax=Buchnera aphidicola TaxID=9 RepID=UPI0031B6BEBC
MKLFIYISCPEDETIEVWKFKNSNSIELIQKIFTPGQAQPIKIIKKINKLYVGIRPKYSIITYNINLDGTLNEFSRTRLPVSPNHISSDINQNFLFVSSYKYGSIVLLPLDNFYVPQKYTQKISILDGCHFSYLEERTNTLFVTSLLKDKIYLYPFKKKIGLEEKNFFYIETNKKSGPRHMAFHKKKEIAYSINELNSTVNVWKLSKNIKKIKCIQTINILPNNYIGSRWAAEIRLNLFNNFLYTSDRAANLISLFSINEETNLLKFEKCFKTENQPRSFNIDEKNKKLIVLGQKSNRMIIYNICSKTGYLLKEKSILVGKGPIWLETLYK